MDFADYQKAAATTAVYPGHCGVVGMAYVGLGLASEAGEVAGKLKKVIRDDDGRMSPEVAEKIKHELGDVLWYLSQSCTEFGFDLAEIAQMNVDKLADRKARGVLHGSGDNR